MSALSTLRLETATFTAWPAMTTAMDGAWLARFARGYTKRSNSIQCLDPADDADAAARLGRLAELYALNSLEPIFRVTPLAGPEVIAVLDAEGWAPYEESRVLAMPLSPPVAAPGHPIRTFENEDRAWVVQFGQLSGAARRSLELQTQLLDLIAVRHAGVVVVDAAGEPAATALAINAAGVGVFNNVITRADLRGRGYGRAVMQAALNWTQTVGASHAAIQVVSANTPAVDLYTSLGFSERYRYHYRRPR